MVSSRSSSHRRKFSAGRIALIALLVLMLIFLGGWAYWNVNKKQIIRAKIDKVLEARTAGLYAVNYDDLVLDELAGNLSLINMRIGYDSVHYDSILRSGSHRPLLLQVRIPSISVTGVKTKKALQGKELVGKKLLIDRPEIKVIYTGKGKEASRNFPTNEIYRELLGDLDLIQVDTVVINDARIVTYNQHSNRDSVIFEKTHVELNGLSIDSASNLDKSRILFARSINFSTDKIAWSARSGLYRYAIAGLSLNSSKKTIRINRVDINPYTNEAGFVKNQRYQEDRLDIHLNDISLSNVDFTRFMDEILVADQLVAGSVSLKLYRDKRVPRINRDKTHCDPHQLIMKIPFPVVIRQARFPNTLIEYKEVSELTGRIGTVQFREANLKVYNLTNDRTAIQKNNTCRVEMNARLLDIALLRATLSMRLGDPSGAFEIEGGAGSTNAVKLNQLAEPMGLAHIRSGNLNKLEFRLKGDVSQASGDVMLLYDNLKVDLLELDEEKMNGLDRKNVTTLLANIFIKDENPSRGDSPRVAQVSQVRDKTRSFYHLVWKSIFEGINLSIGNKKKARRT